MKDDKLRTCIGQLERHVAKVIRKVDQHRPRTNSPIIRTESKHGKRSKDVHPFP